MNPLLQNPPRTLERAPGVFQCHITHVHTQLTVEHFAAVGLLLPVSLQKAIHKRQMEFLMGRYCVQQCFAALGLEAPEIPMNDDRSPEWPAGIVGSVSHSQGHAAAVLARSTSVAGLGLDLEGLIENPSAGLLEQICLGEDECAGIEEALSLSRQEALTLIFSSKESLYKTVYPRHGHFFGFQSARVDYEDGLRITLQDHLSDTFHAGRSWPVAWRSLTDNALETLIIEPKV